MGVRKEVKRRVFSFEIVHGCISTYPLHLSFLEDAFHDRKMETDTNIQLSLSI